MFTFPSPGPAALRRCRTAAVVLTAAGLALAGTTASAAQPVHAAATTPAAVTVHGLRIDDRTDQPLGVDDTSPTLSWQLDGSGAVATQTAYEVRAVDETQKLLWDSGEVASAQQKATYAGTALTSREDVSWQVRVWDGNGVPSAWSAPSAFEMGLLQQSDWGDAQWIQSPPPPLNRGVSIDVGAQSAQYVRIDVTKLGLPINESSYGLVSRVMLSEIQVLDATGTNVALGGSVSVYDQYACPGCGTKLLTDGKIISPGYASRQSSTQDLTQAKWIQINLGAVKSFDQVVLYPRTDARLADGQIPDFPVNFTIAASTTSNTGSTPAAGTVIKTITDEPNPPGPDIDNPLPIFAKPFTTSKQVADARLYIAGAGQYDATINGKPVTDTVLNPGVTNPLRSEQYGTYDVTKLVQGGENTIGVALGNGQTDVYPQTNAAAGRNDVYTKFNSTPIPNGTLTAAVAAGDTTVSLSGVGGYSVGDTVNVDTGDGGTRLESRKVSAVNTTTNTLTVATAFGQGHASGATVLGSGSPTVGEMTVSPRLIARLELTYSDGTTSTVATDPTWQVKDGPTITDNWYAGEDYDARAVQAGWNEPGADLSAAQGWGDSSITSPPSLDTKLVWREAPPVRVQKTFTPVSIKKVADGDWSFDLGQNFAGMPQLHLPAGNDIPAGTVIRLTPGETASGNGAVSTASAGSATGILDTYTTSGDPKGETWSPTFMYHGFQYVEVSGLPADFVPDDTTLVGLQTNADVPSGGNVTTSDTLINTIHSMSEYSIRSNMQSIFTDCPTREKLGWLADMIQSMGAIHSDFDVSAFLRTTEQNMLESQQPSGLVPGTAPEFPNFGGGYRDDVNWGGAFILTPYELWKTYGDTDTMARFYAPMQAYLAYIRAQIDPTTGLLVSGLGDWIAGDTTTPKTATGTYGLYMLATDLAAMATQLGHTADAADYTALASSLGTAFNKAFYDAASKSFTTDGTDSTTGSQTLDALPLAMGIVPAADKDAVLDDLEKRIYAYHPDTDGDGSSSGPHMSGGEVGLQPTYEVLMDNGRSDVLWDVLQEPSAPSYQNFVAAGRTTIPESWDMAGSQNHMILLQIDEWFNAGLAGIQQAADSAGFDDVVIKPQPVGTLDHVSGDRQTPHGAVTSQWTRNEDGTLDLDVTIPANTTGEVWVPNLGKGTGAPAGATFVRDATEGDTAYTVYSVGAGSYSFTGGISALTSTVAPQITGVAKVGQKLTADAGSWNHQPSDLTYQWLRDGDPIPGATDATYQVVAADRGAELSVKVTASAHGLSDASATSGSITIGAGTLLPTALPTISGTAKVGSRLTATAGAWPAGTAVSYQWTRDGRPVAGATGARYTLTAADATAAVSVRVTATRDGYTTATAESHAVLVAPGTFANTHRPKVKGAAKVGHRLKAKKAAFSPRPSRVTYQWYRNGKPIHGATAATYKAVTSDAGHRVKVAVTAHAAGYDDLTVKSVAVKVRR
ncbi:family 78 glycoside hydrolase catalytic domain [Nocardioides sp. BP30]|uniref:family 78 glycoside hydrolase catalytic domain n=1 Tax=Nocardioides sp. BP30 TaxID=3036374 RepID=UPI0024691006|nr:family 78 glycoside hydrolase catalytic domain [Nocardioides sp. BP30]WGL52566.1 family 78 glycoside hydrolase catalytic domain [Nocardioides sp. BP30]